VWYFTPSRRTLTWITTIHRKIYTATHGVLGSSLPQLEDEERGLALRWLHVLLLTTKGRKTGTPRIVPLPYFVYDGRTFIVASFTGLDQNPAWYANLAEQPEVGVQIGSRRRRCRAVTLGGNERERIWALLSRDWARYRVYQSGTRRAIPVVELIPA
jgi:deazaflavin-dependent oxidoreductase (nitroreductase family)